MRVIPTPSSSLAASSHRVYDESHVGEGWKMLAGAGAGRLDKKPMMDE